MVTDLDFGELCKINFALVNRVLMYMCSFFLYFFVSLILKMHNTSIQSAVKLQYDPRS